jgi:uroporphyrinogen III methyltransferase/synthase
VENSWLWSSYEPTRPADPKEHGEPGRVWLVGAGPGDPALLTLRGRELLETADVVVVDRLVSPVLHGWARPGAEVVHVGKSPATCSWTQEDVNALLVERARAGARVVRLKGGDPYLFGRGGEEAEACAAAGVACMIVPGVTSALAAPAYAGIPVTHRDITHEVVVVSGHLPPGHPDSTVDWRALGMSSATIVILMGVARLMDIADALIGGGRPPATPAAVIERGTTLAQRVLRTTLDALAVDAIAARVRSPAVIVVGDVAARRAAAAPTVASGDPGTAASGGAATPSSRRLRPAGDPGTAASGGAATPSSRRLRPGSDDPVDAARPLAGSRVLVPRTRARQGLLARRLRRLGADAVEAVVARLVPVADPGPLMAALPGADALVLADADEVAAVVGLLRQAGGDVRTLAGLTLVAAGDDAAATLDALGLVCVRSSPDTQPADTASVLEPIPVPEPVSDTPSPVPAADAETAAGSDEPAAGLVAVCGAAPPPAGARTVRRVTLVRTADAEVDPAVAEALRHGDFDVVAFASSTAASATARLYGPLPAGLRVAAMGSRTVAACHDAGLPVDAVAEHAGIHPLADAVVAAARRSR